MTSSNFVDRSTRNGGILAVYCALAKLRAKVKLFLLHGLTSIKELKSIHGKVDAETVSDLVLPRMKAVDGRRNPLWTRMIFG
jgi:hypothetical protein